MRKERFNRLVYLAAVVLHHRSQVQEFLQVHDTITNTLACIVRAFEDIEFLNVFLVVAAVLGIQLIEPYLDMTYYHPLSYEELIEMSKELYEDLQTTPTSEILNLDKLAFRFANKRREMDEVVNWEAALISSVKEAVDHYQEKVTTLLSLLLPKLADGFFVQRGNIFGFGNYDPASPMLVTSKNMEQLNQAPINNMSSERAVGSINHELGVRGRKEINAASSAFLKGKSYDLVELKPASEFLKYKNFVKPFNNLVSDWNNKQSELEEAGLHKKESVSLATEKRKNGDLQKLKAQGGPMTTPEEVDLLVNDDSLTDVEKLDRLYIEVRYARDTTLSLPKSSSIFRLKEKYKKLAVETYRLNLKVYLSKVSSSSFTTWEDYDNAMLQLQNVMC